MQKNSFIQAFYYSLSVMYQYGLMIKPFPEKRRFNT